MEGPSAPPARTIADIAAILDAAKPDPQSATANRAKADAAPPSGASGPVLVQFYYERAQAASRLGRFDQALADLRMARDQAIVAHVPMPQMREILRDLSRGEMQDGSYLAAGRHLEEAADLQNGRSVGTAQLLEFYYARLGDFAKAQRMRDRVAVLSTHLSASDPPAPWRLDEAERVLLEAEGRYTEAEPHIREAIAHIEQYAGTDLGPVGRRERRISEELALADNLAQQGRLVEAEIAAREALRALLEIRGRDNFETAGAISTLASIVDAEGRAAEAERLNRIAISILEETGVPAGSLLMVRARLRLMKVFLSQRKWHDAAATLDRVRHDTDGELFERLYGRDIDWPLALIAVNRAAEAVTPLQATVTYRQQQYGSASYSAAEAAGLLAVALSRTGDRAGALVAFATAIPNLANGIGSGGINGPRGARLETIVDEYLSLSASQHRSDSGSLFGTSDLDEAFEATQLGAGHAVQDAISAAAARADVRDPALATLIRHDQDSELQVAALDERIAELASASPSEQPEQVEQTLQARRTELSGRNAALRQEIERQFPDYARLVHPRPQSIAVVQRALKPGEALIVAFVTERHTFVWVVPRTGVPVLAAAAIGSTEIEAMIAALRKALDPDASTAGDIPAFDTATAYKLYAGLLDPVKAGWQGAKTLLIVANGPLGQLPFGLLTTENVTPAPDQPGQPLFASYKAVPWLIRQVAVAQLPSVTSLTTLRATPPATSGRKPFIGFGDPWFSQDEATQAQLEQDKPRTVDIAGAAVVEMRKAPVKLRSVPKTEDANSAVLADLPRLPETAAEVVVAAEALQADPAKDVYLGAQANEQMVETLKLDDRRVIMFATHGLVPGDLDGLTEPALALSAPEVTKTPGDGLLTVSKILGLRLDADWVVLSACNTAAGNGAGAEAVSGLGLAFFYAGTRALLVSNWPVETSSARALTSELFRREAASPGLGRAEALRQSMITLMDSPGFVGPDGKQVLFSYAHPIFWAPFSLVGDGSGG